MSFSLNTLYVGEKFRILRKRSGLSQKRVASYLGVSRNFVASYEKMKIRIDLFNLDKLCDLFGCSLSSITDSVPLSPTIEYIHPLCYYADDSLPGLAKTNRLAINLLEMQRLFELGNSFSNRTR